MSIAGSYQHIKDENYIEYLQALGLSEDKAKELGAHKPQLRVAIEANRVSLTNSSGADNSTSTFTLDQEVDEPLPNNVTLKSTARLDGDALTVTSKTPSGKILSRVYKLSGAELVVAMSSSAEGPTGKRFYNKV